MEEDGTTPGEDQREKERWGWEKCKTNVVKEMEREQRKCPRERER
jgi:hypothetical protein